MSDYLTRLAERTLGVAETVAPRVPGLFDPPPDRSDEPATVETRAVTEAPRRAPVAPPRRAPAEPPLSSPAAASPRPRDVGSPPAPPDGAVDRSSRVTPEARPPVPERAEGVAWAGAAHRPHRSDAQDGVVTPAIPTRQATTAPRVELEARRPADVPAVDEPSGPAAAAAPPIQAPLVPAATALPRPPPAPRLAAAVQAAIQARQQTAPRPIRVTIGRVEVRANLVAAPPTKPRETPPPRGPSLEAYLRRQARRVP